MKLRITVTAEIDIPPDMQPEKTDGAIRLWKDNAEWDAQRRVRNWFPKVKEPKITSTATIEI